METVAEEESIHLSRDGFLDVPNGARDPDRELMEATRGYLNQVTENSKLFQKLSPVPSLNPNEIQLSEVLGAGEFCLVCIVESINMISNGNSSISSLMRNAAAAAHGSFCKIDQFDLSSSPGHHHIIDFEYLAHMKQIKQNDHEEQPFEKSFATSSVTFTNTMLSFEASATSLPDFTEATVEDDLAPEVVLCEPYGLSVDVYSFGLVFWEIFSLEKPFGNYRTLKQFTDGIIHKQQRPPKLQKLLPDSLQKLVSESWAHDHKQRPSFQIICRKLQQELWMWQKVGKEDDELVSDRTEFLRQNSWRSFKKASTSRKMSLRSLFPSGASSRKVSGADESARGVSKPSSKDLDA